MAIFGDFFASCIFSEQRAARFRPASEIRKYGSMADIQSVTAEIRRGKKKEEERRRKKKEEETTGQKYNGLPYSIGRATIITILQMRYR